MKATNIIKTMAVVTLTLLLSTSMFAQDKPAKKDACCSETAKHVCTDECKTEGCAAVKAKEGKTAKHVCTEECKTEGCAAVKAEECEAAKHVCTEECKTKGCDAVKAKECKTAEHVCRYECKTAGCDAVKAKEGISYECPMKCEPASSKPGECSKCGMDLKKKA